MSRFSAFSLREWIDEHRHLLKPPVGNTVIWENTDFMVMIVGGPNLRKDYHINPTEEFYYQLEGDITLKVIADGEKKDIPIRQGDVFLLPPNTPHSPQRPANTVGMVIERRRPDDDHDRLLWYCESCGDVLHGREFHLTNLATQIKPVIEEFMENEALRTCRRCGAVMEMTRPAAK